LGEYKVRPYLDKKLSLSAIFLLTYFFFFAKLKHLIKSFCGGPGGGFYKKSPLAAGGKGGYDE
jgi:hypothetical protein